MLLLCHFFLFLFCYDAVAAVAVPDAAVDAIVVVADAVVVVTVMLLVAVLKSFSSTRVSISIESMGSSIERNNAWTDGRRRRYCVNMPSYWW